MYKLQILSSRNYDQLASKYPKKVRNRIFDSKGFTDMNRNISFIRGNNDKTDMAGTAIHEILEMAAKISPHEECRLRFKGKSETPQVSYTQSPEYQQQMDLFKNIQTPYLQSQYDLYKNQYAPSAQQLGGQLQSQLATPFNPQLNLPTLGVPTEYSLPEDQWAKVWQQSREKALAPFDTQSRQMSQRFASTGALDNSGQVNKAFQNLDYQKQKSIETQAIDQAIQEWTEKKQINNQNTQLQNQYQQANWQNQVNQTQQNWQSGINANQQVIQNMMAYLQEQPQFTIPMPTSQQVVSQPKSSGYNWGTGLSGGAMGGLLGYMLAPATGGLSLALPAIGAAGGLASGIN